MPLRMFKIKQFGTNLEYLSNAHSSHNKTGTSEYTSEKTLHSHDACAARQKLLVMHRKVSCGGHYRNACAIPGLETSRAFDLKQCVFPPFGKVSHFFDVLDFLSDVFREVCNNLFICIIYTPSPIRPGISLPYFVYPCNNPFDYTMLS